MATSVMLSTSFSPTYHPPLFRPSSSIPFSKPKLTSHSSSNSPCWNTKPLSLHHSFNFSFIARSLTKDENSSTFAGEDSAVFDLKKQKISSWIYFTAILGVVLFVLNVAWIDNSTGFSKAFVESVSALSDSHEVVMLILFLIFAVFHSGMASLRDAGEKLIGERAFRVIFAGISLPLAVTTVVYFINHRYDGVQLWQLQSTPGIHAFLWLSNFISFFFLYPSTFNLLEVAAVDKPKVHLWETGIIRITRHPQLVGQVIWCLAHTVWIGNSVAVAASIGLISHHLFGAWNGDRRLAIRYGEDFEVVKRRTSIVPFAAILDGRQRLPEDFYKEFIRLPYLAITVVTLGAYFAHPLMQTASFNLHW
ncbi:15-cis-zeta-carotene isomerase, chloroplastic [Lathyrus oleraceus]|uniref:NnrU domain-containing protein n=1 Tax=Pisum sativum TaxID=3888 RepID=A0A9D4WRC2_PEA|nr:15-cis-zeta-carotene isomerase, chloroplastic-like [Pisum sativum]KAI5406350.1 hypothetical protein KIW84_052911 [Pisum sativum]